MTPKKAGIITCIVSSVLTILTSIGLGIYFFPYPHNNNSLHKNIQFKATSNPSTTIYMSINSSYIQYDLLTENVNRTGYLLTRFFSSPIPTFAQTFINNSFQKKTNA